MSDVTIKQLAKVLGTPIDKLLAQLAEAGMKFTDPEQVISSTEKVKLLGFLRRTHGKREAPVETTSSPRQITLKRRTVSEITVNQGAARGKTVNVEVRQKRTYVKRSEVKDDPTADPGREEALRKLQESTLTREGEELERVAQERKRADEENRQRAIEDERRRAEEARARTETVPPPRVEPEARPKRPWVEILLSSKMVT